MLRICMYVYICEMSTTVSKTLTYYLIQSHLLKR